MWSVCPLFQESPGHPSSNERTLNCVVHSFVNGPTYKLKGFFFACPSGSIFPLKRTIVVDGLNKKGFCFAEACSSVFFVVVCNVGYSRAQCPLYRYTVIVSLLDRAIVNWLHCRRLYVTNAGPKGLFPMTSRIHARALLDSTRNLCFSPAKLISIVLKRSDFFRK